MKAHAVRVGVCALAVAVTSLAVWTLIPIAPDVSLGVLYTLPVLGVAVVWGLPYAVAVSVASLLTFNFFFLPPVHTFTLANGSDWTALVVYLVTAVVTSELASRARRRAAEAERREREAALLADLAAELLERGGLGGSAAGRIEVELAHSDAPARERLQAAVDALFAIAEERARLQKEAFEAESLRRADAVKTAVIRAVSHDLRTPLASIHAAVDGLRSPGLALDADDRAELLDTVASELVRLERFVENLLDLSRLEVGAAVPSRELWSVDDLVAQALRDVDDPRVTVDVLADLPPVRVDGAQVERALSNLVDNALKFSPPGSPVVVRALRSGSDVELRVQDRGRGVPAPEQADMFEPFRRSRDSRGAGLGLAIVRGFVDANGGRVRHEPNPDGGAVFVLTFAAEPLPVATG
jgi:two-component system sensor histidine kinase KdpD